MVGVNPGLAKKLLDSKKLLIFDFDGVLADSVEVKTEAFALLYKPFGQEVVDKVVAHHRDNGGMSRFEKFKRYHNDFLGISLDEEGVDKLSKHFSNLVVKKVIMANEISGADCLLRHYHADEKICVINSATPDREIIKIIEQRNMSRYFSGIYGSPKSKVDNLRVILSRFSKGNAEAVFFGDAEADLNAARELSIDFIGVGDKIRNVLKHQSPRSVWIKDLSGIVLQ